MLEELKNIRPPGNKEDILYFLQVVIGKNSLTIEDIRTICSHAPGKYQLDVDSLIRYCKCFNWIEQNSRIYLDEAMKHLICSSEKMNAELVRRTVDALFKSKVLRSDQFFFEFSKE